MQFHYALPDGDVTVQIEPDPSGYSVTVLRPDQEPVSYQIDAHRPEHGQLTLCVGDRRVRAHVAKEGKTRYVALSGQSWRLEPPQARGRKAESGGGSLSASMPGKVLDVLVEPGQAVEMGQPLVVLEAMKMELRVIAPADGIVSAVHVGLGDVVDMGQALVELD